MLAVAWWTYPLAQTGEPPPLHLFLPQVAFEDGWKASLVVLHRYIYILY